MPTYDFDSLSSQDFEELTRDLLQAEWKTAIEAFRTGRDGGIDLRYTRPTNSPVVIQCKHYINSGFNKLLSDLDKKERPKIEILKPYRYVLVTSLQLTPHEKDQIISALAPYILSTSDVIGANDLEGLLSRHPRIEQRNFKLWLTSTNVIERVLHNAQICQTEFEIQRIRQKLPLFVQSEAFPKAMDMLKKHRILIVSGAPGIGKTTLAEMLLYTHLDKGFEPVVIKGEISEGKSFFRKDGRRIFYFDDFLGQVFLRDRSEYLGQNQDAALLDFMQMVQQSDHSRFILTTRAHVLSTALQISEKLAASSMLHYRYVLELRTYTFAHRARILYNHLYFSKLPNAYKEAILVDDFFLEVIRHEHFNPRLIEWLSSYLREREVGPGGYRNYIKGLLRSPHEIWRGAFQNQISEAARSVLVSVYTVGELIDTVDLEPVFRSLHSFKSRKYRIPIKPGEFRSALRELDGGFLSYGSGRVSYLNPSLREFIGSVIADDRDTAEDVLRSAIRFKQFDQIRQLAANTIGSALAQVWAEIQTELHPLLEPLLGGPSTRWERTRFGTRGYPIDMGVESRLAFLIELAEGNRALDLVKLTERGVGDLIKSWALIIPDFSAVLRLMSAMAASDWFLENGGKEIHRRLLEGLVSQLSAASAADWVDLATLPEVALGWDSSLQFTFDIELREYCEKGIEEEKLNCGGPEELRGLADSLQALGNSVQFDFHNDIRELEREIARLEEEDRREEMDEGGYAQPTRSAGLGQVESEEDVRQMFATLRRDS